MKPQLLSCFLFFFIFSGFAQTTYTAGNETQLNTAISSAASGDVINITGNIVITGEKLISGKSLTINGNGYAISVPVTGVDDQGKFNTSPSNFRVFNLAGSGVTYTINDLIIKGGSLSAAGTAPYHASGGTVLVQQNVTLHMNRSVISNGRCNATTPGTAFSNLSAGGAIAVWGTVFMEDCFVVKNAAHFAGALFVQGTSAALYMNKCTISQNRNTNTGGGGGAAEIQGYAYFNNSTFSNNIAMQGGVLQSGGAVSPGYVYVLNSSFTGNVVLLTGTFKSAAVASYVAPSAMYVANSVFAYNYAGNSHTNPTTYTLSDFGGLYPQYTRAYYCIVHQSTWADASMNVTGNITYTGAINGSDNSIFSGGILSKITDGNGTEIGTAQVYRPLLYTTGGYSAPTLKTASFLLDAARLGVATRYNNNNNLNPVVAYNSSGSTYTAIGSLANIGTSTDQVLIDQAGNTRNVPPIRGAIDAGGVISNLYYVKVNAASNGTVNGGTIFGDTYAADTQVTLTAIPNSGYSFTRWDYVTGGTGVASASNPYSFTVTGNVTLVPVYTVLGSGNYAITYVGNGHTEGTAPSGGIFSAATTLPGAGTMAKDGYIFNGWNTNANGSGTNYASGANYNAGANITLYTNWQEVLWIGGSSTDGSVAANWSTGLVPAANTSFAIAGNANQNLVLTQNMLAKNIRFRNAGKKIQLGGYELSVNSVANADANNYINTNGAGKLKKNITPGGTYTFPVGNGSYTPVSITNNSGATDNFFVRVLDEVYQGGLSGLVSTAQRITKSWDISKTNANGASGVDMLFEWPAAQNSGVTAPGLYHYNGSSWQELSSANASSPTQTSFRYAGYTGTFSPFAIAQINSTLPLTWLNFTAVVKDETAVLHWQTTGEQNTKDFIIQYSRDAINWQNIGTTSAAGSATGIKTYHFVHNTPAEGVNYYRILQLDVDGQYSFSKTNSLRYITSNPALVVFANPVYGGMMRVNLKQATEAALWGPDGKNMWRGKLSQGENAIDVSRIANGAYLLQTPQKTIKIIIVR